MNFNEFAISPEILKALEKMGFSQPTDIQSQGIPAILKGGDVIGRSSTGTGKTVAFGIPSIEGAREWGKNSVLILSPTRELAIQITGELRKLCDFLSDVSLVTIYGGTSMSNQIQKLKTSKIVVGTPGRIMDHLKRRTLRLDNLKMIVLDEADEMLNMGFIDDIRTILDSAPKERQTILFSATMPKAIMNLTEDFQEDPLLIAVDGGKRTVSNIEQSYYDIPKDGKKDAIKLLLEYHRPKKALIFCNTKKMVDELASKLREEGFKALGLHGDINQKQRSIIMKEFKSVSRGILIATDVAARGIDVDDVEAVLNYDLPKEYEYYIHRIGRTGRAGKKGASYTLITSKAQLKALKDIEKYIECEILPKEVPSLESIFQLGHEKFAKDLLLAIDRNEGKEWKTFIKTFEKQGISMEELACVLCSKIQNQNKRLIGVKNIKAKLSKDSGSSKEKSRGNNPLSRGEWVRISIGGEDKIAPNFILGAIIEATNLKGSDVGKINIYPKHTDVSVSKEHAMIILHEMKGTKIRKKPVTFTILKEQGSKRSNTGFKKEQKFSSRSSNSKGNTKRKTQKRARQK